MRVSTMAETIHYSTLIEGNRLSELDARRAVRKALDAKTLAEIELVNYVDALEHVEQMARSKSITYDEAFLLDLHARITRGLGREGEAFAPPHEGAWRDGEASVVTGDMIEHTGVPRAELERRMAGFLAYLRARHEADDFPRALIAGIAHHALADFHPFADGNGRTSRAFAFAILVNEGVLSERLFSPDRFYALDKRAYITALRSSHRSGYSSVEWHAPGLLDPWLAYFVDGLASEAERVAAATAEYAEVAGSANRVRLTPAQAALLAELTAGGRSSVSRAEFQEIGGITNDSKALRELRELVDARVLSTTGKGASTRYRIGTGRGPRWTPETIEAELRTFLNGRADWPSAREFKDADLQSLYVALSRHGSIPEWRHRLGYPDA